MGWRLQGLAKLWGALERVNNRSGLLTKSGLYAVGELSEPIVHFFE
jgi:hypothetical protein